MFVVVALGKPFGDRYFQQAFILIITVGKPLDVYESMDGHSLEIIFFPVLSVPDKLYFTFS